MQSHLPRYLIRIVNRLEFLAVPNLGTLVIGLSILGFIAIHMFNIPASSLMFDPRSILEGEYTRLFAFPLETGSHPIWLFFYCLVIYYIFNGLEQEWGPGPLTVFVLFSYLCCIGAGFLFMQSVPVWKNIVLNVSLAFGTIFPNFSFYLMFVIPMKAKWMAMIAGVYFAFQFIVGGMGYKIYLLLALFPYLLFFGPYLIKECRQKYSTYRHKKRFDKSDWS